MKIWEFGSWPGLWKNTPKNKKRYVEEYALEHDFVALGFGWIDDFRKKNDIDLRRDLENYKDKDGRQKLTNIDKYLKEIKILRDEVSEGDIVLLYLDKNNIYIGEVKEENPYYYVPKNSEKDFIKDTIGFNRAPHRIDVKWKDKKSYQSDELTWQGSLREITADKLSEMNNQKLKTILESKINERNMKEKNTIGEEVKEKVFPQKDEKIFDNVQKTFDQKYKEGAERIFVQTIKERDPKLRANAIKKYGRNCMVCNFNYDNCYGEDLAEGYIEVHHCNPLAKTKAEVETSINDVIVVCSNCHRIIHRKRDEILDWKKLKKKIQGF